MTAARWWPSAPQDTVEHAARLMYDRRVKRLPVVDAGGHLVGIISRADVLVGLRPPGLRDLRGDRTG